tara:strand:+ start:86 stop:208 length:123 start_codon:yes stop_codon:yes gene_type:complete
MNEIVIVFKLEKAMAQSMYLTIYYDNKVIRSSWNEISDKV